MKKIPISEVKVGMVLAMPIFLGNSDVELLNANIEITERQIKLMNRLGVEEIYISDESCASLTDPYFIEHDEELSKKEFDRETLIKDIKESQKQIKNLEETLKSEYNQNMVINVITGEGNTPIDQKHVDLIEHTKMAFEKIKTSDELDIDSIRADITKALPDMIKNDDVLMRLSQLKVSDDYTFEHSLRVSILATMIGKWLGYSMEELNELAQAALLFDIGKMKIPEFILNKETPLRKEELDIMQKHSQLGYSILLKTKGVTNAIKYAALQHHERIDGSGYPLRLKESQIHDFAKIIMVCDVFDAMTNTRSYKVRVSPFEAAEYLLWNSGKTFDSKVVYILVKNLADFYIGKQVLLNTRQKGKIVYVDVNYPTKPIIQVGDEFYDLTVRKDLKIIELFNYIMDEEIKK